MDVRHLRALVHISELGSISLAAGRLGIAQPALTRQVQALEAELGVRLFHRHGRGVVLTPEGERLKIRACSILRELDEARSELKPRDTVLQGAVNFGIPPTLGDVLCGPLIEKFLSQHPQVKLRISSAYSGYVLDWLQRGSVDIAVVYELKPLPTIRTRLICVGSLFHIQAGSDRGEQGPIDFAEVIQRPLILPSGQHGLRLLLEEKAAQIGMTIQTAVEVDSLPLQIELVERGIASTILPMLSVFKQVRDRRLVARPIAGPELTRSLAIATPLDRQFSQAVREFSVFLEDAISELIQSEEGIGSLL